MRQPAWIELLMQVKLLAKRAHGLTEASSAGDTIASFTGLVKGLYILDQGKVASKTEATRWFVALLGGKAGDAANEANRLRKGDFREGTGSLRRLSGPFLEAIDGELARLERRVTAALR